jgi:hypothetical protein
MVTLVVASHPVGSLSELFGQNLTSDDCLHILWNATLPRLMQLHGQDGPLDCSRYILLTDIESWLTQLPHLGSKLIRIQKIRSPLPYHTRHRG